MSAYKTKSPVLMIVFNRPDKALKVLETIRAVTPSKLYIAADGPRSERKDDIPKCEATRAIKKQIDWDCEVKTLFQPANLGCGLAPATAITWFLDQESQGIILEDDCIPNQSFFKFCDELLERYKEDTRVMQISGTNYHRGWKRDPDYSYYFSGIGHCWGWATWRRAWQHFDFYVKKVPEMEKKGYLENFLLKESVPYFAYHPNIEKEHWDYQWDFAKFIQSGLSVIPNTNLVENIGLDEDSTHNFDPEKYKLELGDQNLFPLSHPPFIVRDSVSDQRYYQAYWAKSPLYKLKMNIKKVIPSNIWGLGKSLYSKMKTANV